MKERLLTIKEERELKKVTLSQKVKLWFKNKKFLNRSFAGKVNTARKAAGVLLVVSFLFQAVIGALPGFAEQESAEVKATTPNLQTVVQVTNVTQAEVGWHKQNEARPGDVLKYQIWYHNYRDPNSGLVARNVNVKGTLPTTPSKNIVTRGTVSASNATAVSDTASTSLLTPETLSYIPNTTILRHKVNGNWVDQRLADGITTHGVNIGNVNPCWDYQGTVTFQVKVSSPNIKITKEVKIEGESQWRDENTASSGDNLAYLISYQNTGSNALTNLIIRDNLPSYVTYVPGSTKLYVGTDPNPRPMPDRVTGAGLNLGTYGPNTGGYVRFNARVNSNLSPGRHCFDNTGIAKSDQTLEFWDTARTCVTIQRPQEPNFVISKSAFNETQNVNATTTMAHAGDTIRYNLITQNTGDEAGPYTIQDNIGDILLHADITNNGGGNVNGNTISYGTVTVNPGQTIERNFWVRIKPVDQWPGRCGGDLQLVNVYGNQVVVNLGCFEINRVKSATNNTQVADAVAVNAHENESITYTLTTTNTGNEAAEDVVVRDDISNILQFADIENANGGTVQGNFISWPEVDIPAGGSVQNTFVVRIKNPVDIEACTVRTMGNSYGNLITVNVEKPCLPPPPPPPPTPTPQILGASVANLAKTGANNPFMWILMLFIAGSSVFLYAREKMLFMKAARGV